MRIQGKSFLRRGCGSEVGAQRLIRKKVGRGRTRKKVESESGAWHIGEKAGSSQGRGQALHPGLTGVCPPQIRASRLEQIDKELLEAQDRVQQTEPQVPEGLCQGRSGW